MNNYITFTAVKEIEKQTNSKVENYVFDEKKNIRLSW